MPVPSAPMTPQPQRTVCDMPSRGRRSFAPGMTLSCMESPGGLKSRRSIAPRSSTMPSAANRLGGAGHVVAPMPVSFSEHQATKAENNRLRHQLDQVNEKLDEERALRQKKEDEAIAFFKKMSDLEQRLTRTQRLADRAGRIKKREEDEKVKGEEQLKGAIDDLQDQLKEIEDDKEAQTAKLQELSRSLAAEQRTTVALRGEVSSTRHENEELKQTAEGLEGKLQAAQTEVSELRARLEQAEGTNSSMRDTMSEYRSEAEGHAKELGQKVDNLTIELEDKSDENTELHTQISALEEAKRGLLEGRDATEAELAEKTSALSKVERAHGELTEEHAKVRERCECAESRLEQTESELAERTSHLGQKTEHLSQAKAELLALKQSAVEVKSDLKLREDDLAEAELQKGLLGSQVEELTQEVAALQGKLEKHSSEDLQTRKVASEEHRKLMNKAAEAKEAVSDQKRRIVMLEKQLRASRATADDLTKTHSGLVQDNEDLSDKVADLTNIVTVEQHNAKKQELIASKLREKITEKDAQNKTLRKKNKTLIEQANGTIDGLNAKVKELETALSDAQAEYQLLAASFKRYRVRRYSAASVYHDAAADGVVGTDTHLRDDVSDGSDVASDADDDGDASDTPAAPASTGAAKQTKHTEGKAEEEQKEANATAEAQQLDAPQDAAEGAKAEAPKRACGAKRARDEAAEGEDDGDDDEVEDEGEGVGAGEEEGACDVKKPSKKTRGTKKANKRRRAVRCTSNPANKRA